MGVDQNEARRRRHVDQVKPSTRHPIAAIEKRVIDSDALADCRPSSIFVLLLFARNLAKGRNGHTFVSQEDAARHGVEKKTFYRALLELQTHGFIFPTSRGGHGRCGTYALTWLPLSKDTEGLQVGNFKPCAWRDWGPAPEKNRGGRMPPSRGQKSPQPVKLVVKNPPSLGDKNPPLEVIPISSFEGGVDVDRAFPTLKVEKPSAHPEKPAARKTAAKPERKTCSECGQLFTAKRTHAIAPYALCCSPACKTRAYRKRVRQASAPIDRSEVQPC